MVMTVLLLGIYHLITEYQGTAAIEPLHNDALGLSLGIICGSFRIVLVHIIKLKLIYNNGM